MKSGVALLSFDIEEFDLPEEHGVQISFDKQLSISVLGLERILKLLRDHNICATFYSTVVFAQNNSSLIKSMVAEGHEIASHGYCHGKQLREHLSLSKQLLQEITGCKIKGYRAPRMGEAANSDLVDAGYLYNSSMNPTYIPGRYNNLSKQRKLYTEGGLLHLPASVGYPVRVPLFWLAFNNLPHTVYRSLALTALRKDGYLNIYFHPWEFNEQIAQREFRVPSYIKRHAGGERIVRLSNFIDYLKSQGVSFMTTSEYLKL